MDAREFVRWHVRQSSEEKPELLKEFLRFDHCYMNLPVDAVEFCDVFIGLFKDANPEVWWRDQNDSSSIMLPLVHVYGFTFEKERENALKFFVDRIGKAMEYPSFSDKDVLEFHNIRDVSSTSHMYSTSFRLPYEVAMGEYQSVKK